MTSLARRFRKKIESVEPVSIPVDTEDKTEETGLQSEQTLSEKAKSIFAGFKNRPSLTVEDHVKKIKGMSKAELDKYAENYEIYLDRRQNKTNMINEFIQKLKEKN